MLISCLDCRFEVKRDHSAHVHSLLCRAVPKVTNYFLMCVLFHIWTLIQITALRPRQHVLSRPYLREINLLLLILHPNMQLLQLLDFLL
jgi:hypothetical protein